MSHPYDATLKELGKAHDADFVALFHGPTDEPVKPLNVDLSTVTTSADLVFGLGDPRKEVVHLDFPIVGRQEQGEGHAGLQRAALPAVRRAHPQRPRPLEAHGGPFGSDGRDRLLLRGWRV